MDEAAVVQRDFAGLTEIHGRRVHALRRADRDRGARSGQVVFRDVHQSSREMSLLKHFAAVQLDEVACPSYTGDWAVAPSQYKGKPAGDPPAAYGFPYRGNRNLGSPAEHATITNYVALSATHFSCMQYGAVEKLAATTTIPAGAEAPNGMIVPGVGLNMKTCTDGTSKTLMLCETIEPAMNCWYDGTTAWTTAINPNSMCSDGSPPRTSAQRRRRWQSATDFGLCRTAARHLAECWPRSGPRRKPIRRRSPAIARRRRSFLGGRAASHAGGIVNHAAVDGAVHPITPDIDPTLYMHLVTRAGREPDAIPDNVN